MTESAKEKTPRRRGLGEKGRAEANRKMRQDALREKLQGHVYLQQIEKSRKDLDALSMRLHKERATMTAVEVTAARARIKAIEAVVNLNFRRLAKVLPDLKSLEISDPDGKNPLDALAAALGRAVGAPGAD